MSDDCNDLSDAIIFFLGFDCDPSPRRDHGRLVREFGAARASLLEPEVVSLLDEVGAIHIDWSVNSLESAGEIVRAEVRVRHPDLSDAAARALAWKFTFDWR